MKIIEVIADHGHRDTIIGIAEQHAVTDWWRGADNDDGRESTRLLVGPANRQQVLDGLQKALGVANNVRIMVIPLEAVLPDVRNDDEPGTPSPTREELYTQIHRGSRLDLSFLLLVALSTVVAAIGLLEDNVAVIIGAMVIAPLLGPNIALALATALADRAMIGSSIRTLAVGLCLATAIAYVIGSVWPNEAQSHELLSRTQVGLSGAILALASGAAAILSLTTGVSSILVGVMVAVALLPPAATVGLLLGQANYELAGGAALLLAVNVVCVNLAANLIFLLRRIRPRTLPDKQRATRYLFTAIGVWLLLLAVLIVALDIPTILPVAA
ncbi:MAG TPA: TIGR00341 family protein [Chromatiaceae bacterium]|jgi:uncharacterized hydrophobic protein (TIGR00341 family)|nr:TIGR00341 family protein [Chromatiaceae bacterium]HIB84132.1 TIGR00341 family protein [Chromatiaceae bacterium]HIN82939.1 TIGR00341 family protein [Chromatiales bacterium]HIO13825.1 TIGR00341 family protein [Chromatiales bacterium]